MLLLFVGLDEAGLDDSRGTDDVDDCVREYSLRLYDRCSYERLK